MVDKNPEQIVRDYLTYLKNPKQATNNGFSARLRAKLETEQDVIEQLRLRSAIEIAEQVDGEELRDGFIVVAATYAREAGLTPGSFAQMGVTDEVLRAAGLLSGDPIVDLRITAGQYSAALDSSSAAEGQQSALAAMGIDPGGVATRGSVNGASTVLLDIRPEIDSDDDADGDWETSARAETARFLPIEIDDPTVVDVEVLDSLGDDEESATPSTHISNSQRRTAEKTTTGATRGRVTQADIRSMLPDEPFTMKSLAELTGASLLTVRKAVESLQDKNIVKAVGQDPDYKGVGRSPMRYSKKPR